MEKIKNFKLEQVKHHDIIIAMTSDQDYEMSRILLVEDYPDYILIEGFHCSCYDFNDTEWGAIKYSKDELLSVMSKWKADGYDIEKAIAPLIIRYITSGN